MPAKKKNIELNLQDELDEIEGGRFSFKKGFKNVGRAISNQAKKESKAIDKLSKSTGINYKKEAKAFGKNALKTTAGVVIAAPISLATGNPIAGGVGSAVIMEKSGLNKKIDGLGFGKGSAHMKARMAAIRAMKKSKSGGSFKAPSENSGGSFKAAGEGFKKSRDICQCCAQCNSRIYGKGYAGISSNIPSVPRPSLYMSDGLPARRNVVSSGIISGRGFLQ
jgi:hypothetical protein